MNNKKHLLKWNTMLWLFAMVLPAILSLAFASAKFPWQILVPFLLFGCLLASNKMLSEAIGQKRDDDGSTPPKV